VVHERLKRVLVLNRPAIDVITSQDGPHTLFYLDPPYLHETRVTTADYAHEMAADDHRNLLGCLATVKGKFLLSGYRSEMYDEFAESLGWHRHDFAIKNHAAGGKSKKTMTECVWCNFAPVSASDTR
jgi:DNA adenine methylase